MGYNLKPWGFCFCFPLVAPTSFWSDNHRVGRQPRAVTIRSLVLCHFPARWKFCLRPVLAGLVAPVKATVMRRRHTELRELLMIFLFSVNSFFQNKFNKCFNTFFSVESLINSCSDCVVVICIHKSANLNVMLIEII